MLMLYALPAGVIVGWLMGGRLGRLHALQLRWAGLALAGLLVQVALFSNAFQGLIGAAAPATYVASSAFVLVFVLRNVRLAGMAVVAVGAAANLAAIVANSGYMPVAASALAALAVPGAPGYSNSRLITSPALAPLTDVFAVPSWVPFADVFSVGDTLIAVGVALVVALVMSERGSQSTRPWCPSATPPVDAERGTTSSLPASEAGHTVRAVAKSATGHGVAKANPS